VNEPPTHLVRRLQPTCNHNMQQKSLIWGIYWLPTFATVCTNAPLWACGKGVSNENGSNRECDCVSGTDCGRRRRLRKTRHIPSSSLITSFSGIPTTPKASGITPMANPLPRRQMVPRSPSQVRAGGTPIARPLRAVGNTPSRMPPERSKHKDHGK
jgi:hypothetical protein